MRGPERLWRTAAAAALALVLASGASPAGAEDPPPPATEVTGKRIVYAVGPQRVWLIEADETLARTYLVSGRRNLPKPGVYSILSRSRWSRSGRVRLEYMLRFAAGRTKYMGFHAIPVTARGRPIQPLSALGTFRSHGCVREAPADAAFLWDWAPDGTPVVVIA